jgi:hypothetical protein
VTEIKPRILTALRNSTNFEVYSGGGDRKTEDQDPISTNKSSMEICTCDPSYLGGIDKTVV